MKTFALFLVLAAIVAAAEIPPFPTSLTLASGAVLRNTKLERWEKNDALVVRHAGGIDPIRVSSLSPASQSAIIAILRAYEQPRRVFGTVYVTTRGAGAYRFAETTVSVYPEAAIRGNKVIEGAKYIGSATTNAEGKFSIQLPNSRPAYLVCFAHRLAGGSTEINHWVVKIEHDETDLTAANSL